MLLEVNAKIFVVLKVNSTDESKVRNKLMKYKEGNKDLWGKVKYNKVPGFEISSKFLLVVL